MTTTMTSAAQPRTAADDAAISGSRFPSAAVFLHVRAPASEVDRRQTMHSRRRFAAVAMWAMLALPISSQLCAQDNRPSAVTDSALARQAAEAWLGLIDVGNVDA